LHRIKFAGLFLVFAPAVFSSPVGLFASSHPAGCDELRAAKTKVYGFRLVQMSEEQIQAKTKDLDSFWKQVQSSGSEGVSCIRGMLAEDKTDHVFQFDAASMLFSVDRSPETMNLVRDALLQTDFQESDPANYLTIALELGRAGLDIRSLAGKLLSNPNASIHISEHDLDLDSDTAALFLYGSMDQAQADSVLITLLRDPEPAVRSAAAHLLAEQMTEESFRTLSKWEGLSKVQEDFRRNDIQTIMKYQAPTKADFAHPKFTRDDVLEAIATLPRTQQEFDEVMSTKGAAFDRQMRDKQATQEEIAQAVAAGPPIYGISEHTAFISSAIATLQRGDFDAIRDARRKCLYNVSDESLAEYLAYTHIMIGLLNRLDLFKEYRSH
jgi:hypothetical protein